MISSVLGFYLFLAASLPIGTAPDPVAAPHFPDILHTFVWRNWTLVPVERMAETVMATPDQILEIGRSMGLPDPEPIPHDQWQRSYITIIRRNWHLLPYNQLLSLLGWSEEKMAYSLREDDFLFHKLGSLKPDCPPLRYRQPNESSRKKAAKIAEIFRELPGTKKPEPLFSFVGRLSEKPPEVTSETGESLFSPRFCSSYFATYGDPLLKDEPDPYPDGYLARLAASGVDGVWLQAVLYKLAPYPWDPELSNRHEERLEQLRDLTKRAGKYNIGVYLYLNEPRAMPLPFFENREHLKGVVENDHAALCVSTPEVRQYLEDSIAYICRKVPRLAGFFTITGSENLTNCWSHHKGMDCPRCSKQSPEDVISDVNISIRKGIAAANSKTRLIAWDWGWKDEWAPGIIKKLPGDVALMSVSEWSIPIARGGIETTVGEYSISVVGPGPRALKHWSVAAENGLESFAKLQVNNTWELSSVPYIPAVANVARQITNLRDKNIKGLMLGWTLGGHPSPNLEVVAELSRPGNLTVDQALLNVAANRFGRTAAPAVVSAWETFSTAFSEFPYHAGTVYNAPLQAGPSNLLHAQKSGYKSTMVGLPYDDLDSWRSVYPPDIFIQQMEKVAEGFRKGVQILNETDHGDSTTALQRGNLAQEKRVTEVCAIHFQSVANQSSFVLNRDALAAAEDYNSASPLITRLRELLREELNLASRLRQLQLEDSRFGFEASNHYFYIPQDLAEKVLNCQFLLEEWLPTLEKRFLKNPAEKN